MHEKPFESITVENVLHRAGVGRSTFYTHYLGKEDLFISDAEDFFELMATMLKRRGEVSSRVAPVQELFAHVADARKFHRVLVSSGKIHDLLELGRGHFARAISDRLSTQARSRDTDPEMQMAMGHALAGSLMSLLSWWMDRGMRETPAEMDALFHRIVWNGVSIPRHGKI